MIHVVRKITPHAGKIIQIANSASKTVKQLAQDYPEDKDIAKLSKEIGDMQSLLIATLPEAQSLQDQMLKQARQVTSLQGRLVEGMKQYKPHLVARDGMMYDTSAKPIIASVARGF